jgi:beta-mannosidase
MEWQELASGWSLRATRLALGAPRGLSEREVAAGVPGCVHTDLLAAGVIPDPYLDRNELSMSWIGHSDWRWTTTLHLEHAPATQGRRADLVFEGLDTVAEVRVNQAVLGRTANMHRTYRFEVTEHLRAGDNEVEVTITSPYDYAEARTAELGERPRAGAEPFNMIRKMACNFGWDWGPTLVTSGIWRPVRLEMWQVARLARVRPLVDVRGDGTGVASVHVDVERTGPGGSTQQGLLEVRAEVAGSSTSVLLQPEQTVALLTVEVPHVRRWWPHDRGEQVLHELDVQVSALPSEASTRTSSSGVLDRWSRRIGFRTVSIDTTPDQTGSAFTVVVNGQPVFVRGADWIPDDCFPSRVTSPRYRQRIDQAVGAGINFLRVWGGGIYEDDAFYQACDEAGVLVWQDFLFACAAYPEEEPFPREVEAEARDNIARLCPHPSLAVWNANNENIWGYYDWGWQERLAGRTWGKSYYLDLLPRLVSELDPTRPYVPGSPSSETFETHPNADTSGVVHEWDVWNRVDYTHYRDRRPRFVSEFGFQAPATWATLRRSISDPELAPASAAMLHHQKANDGQGKLERGMAPHLPAPRPGDHAFDDWLWLTQLNQARAVSFGIEHFRSLSPYCAGTVVWQLNDCWPVTSWSAIDGYGRRKPLWYAMAHAYADRLLTVQPREGDLAVVVVNDAGDDWTGALSMQRRRLDGVVLAEAFLDLSVPPRSSRTVKVPDQIAKTSEVTAEVLLVQTEAVRAMWTWVEDIDLDLPVPRLQARVELTPTGAQVTVTAETFLRDLALFADRLHPDATVDDMLFTLFPGESATFNVVSPEPPDTAALVRPPVLRSVADGRIPLLDRIQPMS